MTIAFPAFLYLALLVFIFAEEESEAPRFLARPQTVVDYMRIVMHALEFAVVTWLPASALARVDQAVIVITEIVLVLCLGLASIACLRFAPRFAKNGWRIAICAGVLTLPMLGIP